MRLLATKRLTLWMVGVLCFWVLPCFAAIPLFVNHQGVLEVNGEPANGDVGFRFAFIDKDTEVNLWTNDGSKIGIVGEPNIPVNLPVTGGLYIVRLGDAELSGMTALASSVFDSDAVALRIWVDDGINLSRRLSPDHPITSAPYAIHSLVADFAAGASEAINADTVDGKHATELEESDEIDGDIEVHDLDPNAHMNLSLNGANIVSGTISNARLNMGAGKGLDADRVDGLEASAFSRTSHSHNASTIVEGKLPNARLNMGPGGGIDADTVDGLHAADLDDSTAITVAVAAHASSAGAHPTIELDGARIMTGTVADARIASSLARDSEVFGIVTAIDGAASGLDADMVDGVEMIELEESDEIVAASASHNSDQNAHDNIELAASNITSGQLANARINQGSGSALDADTLDGLEAAEIMSSAGKVVQIVNFQTGDVDSHSGTIPVDNTIPQITEGYEYMSVTITPTSATSNLLIEVVWRGATGTADQMTVALFQDSTADALAVGYNTYPNADDILTTSFTHYMIAGTTSATVFKIRAGTPNGYTHTMNVPLFGGISTSSITITEISG